MDYKRLFSVLNFFVGVAGIIVTVLTAPSLLAAVGAIGSQKGLPPGFTNVGGAVATFVTVFVVVAFCFLVVMGIVVGLADVAQRLGAPRPVHIASLTVAGLLALTLAVTLIAFNSSLWLPVVLAAVFLFLAALAASRPTLDPMWMALSIGCVVFIVTGGLSVATMGDASNPLPTHAPYVQEAKPQ